MTMNARWTSRDTEVATIETSGKVTGHKVGNATITVKSSARGGITASAEVTVVARPQEISLNKTSLTLDLSGTKTEQLTATITLKNASSTKSATCTVKCLGKYTITYNANGGSGAPSSQTKTEGVNLTLSGTKPTKQYYAFQGWAISPTGAVAYASGDTYKNNSDLNLYAVWEAVTLKYSGTYGRGNLGQRNYYSLVTSNVIEFKPSNITASVFFQGYDVHIGRNCYVWIQGLDGSNWVNLANSSGVCYGKVIGGQNSSCTVNVTANPTKIYSKYKIVVRAATGNPLANETFNCYISGNLTINI